MNFESFSSNAETNSDNPWLKKDLFDDVENELNTERKNEVVIPEKCSNMYCDMFVQEVHRLGNTEALKTFLENLNETEPYEYSSMDEYCAENPEYVEFTKKLVEKDAEVVRQYTGFEYKNFNVLSRNGGQWIYDELGPEPKKIDGQRDGAEYYLKKIGQLNKIIASAPATTKDFVTTRGTSMKSFMGYDVSNPSVLKKLKGQFFVEKGFMSTSLTKERSFLEHDFEGTLHDECDVEIKYRIPAGSRDIMALYNDNLSYAVKQQEVVVNNFSFNYVSDVVEDESGHVTVYMTKIPRDFYEKRLGDD